MELGKSGGAVDGWVRSGRLHRLHRGVYAVGHGVLTDEGRWMAAVLACGAGAVLSHRTAAALWRIAPAPKELEVTAPRGRDGRSGIVVHRPRRLDPDETTTLRGIPTTTLPRTLVDLADVVTDRELGRAIHEAQVAHSLSLRALRDAAARANGRRGAGRLARAIADDGDATRSELERRFRRLCAEHGIPTPEVNGRVEGFEVDFSWRDARLVAETDGWAYHRTRGAFEEDRRRDQALARGGFRVVRFTHRQVAERPDEVAATLLAALRPGRRPGR